MGLFRRALGRSERSSSTSSSANVSGATTPTPVLGDNDNTNPPAITLTKTSSRLSKTLTWGRRDKGEKEKRRLEDWEKCDEQEWREPSGHKGGRKSKAHQELLRGFEWKFGRNSIDGRRSSSMYSGISPGCSRVGSVDDGHIHRVHSGTRKGSGGGPLSSRDREEGLGKGHMVGTVVEE